MVINSAVIRENITVFDINVICQTYLLLKGRTLTATLTEAIVLSPLALSIFDGEFVKMLVRSNGVWPTGRHVYSNAVSFSFTKDHIMCWNELN